MKKISLFSLLSVIILSCNSSKNEENTSPNIPVIKNGLKIAYYVQDSLKNGFDYYRKMDSLTMEKQTNFQKELERKKNSFQSYVMKKDEQAKSGQLSAFEIQSTQQEIQRKEQELMLYQQNEGGKLETETVEILEVLTKKIEAAGKKYCKKHGIDLLLIHGAGGQINFINKKMNVTKEFISYLNKHQDEIEKESGITK